MLTDITIGQYFPGNSLLHRLDPRAKLGMTLLYMVAVFLPRNWVSLSVAVTFLLAAFSRVAWKFRLLPEATSRTSSAVSLVFFWEMVRLSASLTPLTVTDALRLSAVLAVTVTLPESTI